MNTKHIDKTYEFLISNEENMKAAIELYDAFPKIKNKIIKEFWVYVEHILKTSLLGEKIWDIELDFDGTNTLSISQRDWYNNADEWWFVIYFYNLDGRRKNDSLQYYFDVNGDDKKIKKVLEKINGCVSKNKFLSPMKEWENSRYTKLDYDFNDSEIIMRIINDKEGFAKELAEILIDFSNNIKDDVNKMCGLVKK